MRFEGLCDLLDLVRAEPEAAAVRLVDLHGFGGGERSADVAVVGVSRTAGGVVWPGLAERVGRDPSPRRLRLELGDADAERAGLACGGWVEVMVHPASWLVPLEDFVATRRPVVMATRLGPHGPLGPPEVTPARVHADGVRVEGDVHLQSFAPRPRLVVVGEGQLAAEVVELADWLGASAALAEEAGVLGPLDGVLVLTHDHERATPILAGAIDGGAGYVAALGSRATQAERRRRLAELGADPARLRGPAGLDLGARSPRETALAVVAEWLAATRGRSGAPLSSHEGPING